MKLPLAYFTDPILRKKTERINHIDDDLRRLIEDMIDTIHEHDAVGLAAPQVFRSISLFITHVPIKRNGKWLSGKERVFINPQILSFSKETQVNSEGCLSLPNVYFNVTRPLTIQIQATDINGKTFEETMTEFEACNFMHEYDHLQGILTIDHLSLEEKQGFEKMFRDCLKNKNGLDSK